MAKLGIAAKAYLLSTGTRASWGTDDGKGTVEGSAPASLTEIKMASEATMNLERSENTANVRGNNGWEAVLAGLKKGPVDMTCVYDAADAAQQALISAWLQGTNVPIAFLDGDKATADVEGLWADFQVLKFTKGEPEDGVQTAAFSVKPGLSSVAPEWVRVTGGA